MSVLIGNLLYIKQTIIVSNGGMSKVIKLRLCREINLPKLHVVRPLISIQSVYMKIIHFQVRKDNTSLLYSNIRPSSYFSFGKIFFTDNFFQLFILMQFFI